jgi:nucleoside-diphosphate-sugar epimerase
MNKIGITGGSGIMGQTLRKNFPEYDWVLFENDILNSLEIDDWLKNAGPFDAMLHLAAIVPTQWVEADPAQAIRVNVEGTCRLFSALSKIKKSGLPFPWVFFASTGHVYASSNEPLTEESPLSPLGFYGLTKLQAEQWAIEMSNKLDFKICLGRIFSTCSPLHPETYFLPAMIKKINDAPSNAVLEVRGLLGTRDFLTADLACHAIHFLMKKKGEGIFNISSGKPLKLLSLVKEIQKRLGRDDVKIVALEIETSHLIGNNNKLKKLGFDPQLSLDGLVDPLIQKLIKNPKN